LDAGARARAIGRPHRDRVVPRQERHLDQAVADFAAAYANLNESDHAALAQADKDRRIVAQHGV
jgi:hypothetical protein